MEAFIQEYLFYIGLCFVLRYGSILKEIREFLSRIDFFKKLFSCSLCLGFHIGFWINWVIRDLSLDKALEFGFAVAAACWIADHVIMGIRKYTES